MGAGRTSGVAAAATLALAATGCVSDQDRRASPRAPEQLRPEHVVIAAYPLMDDDNNGYPDTIPIVVYLWDPRYPLPVWADGSFRFTLIDEQDREIASWDVPAEVVESSRRRDQVGAVHQLTLDIRDATSDVRPTTNARLSGEFLGSEGGEATTGRPLGVQIGS